MLQAENDAPKLVAAGVSAMPAEAGEAGVKAPAGVVPAATARRVVGANGEKLVVYEVTQQPHALQDLFEILYCAFVILLLLVGVFRYGGGMGLGLDGGPTVYPDHQEEVADPVCTRLENWITSNGGEIDGVACVNRPDRGGRALISTTALPYRRTYISVPKHLWMHERSLKANSSIVEILNEDATLKEVCGETWGFTGEPCRLMIALMFEREQPDSWWGPYIDSMPEVPTSPIWWGASEKAELQSPILTTMVNELQDYLKETYGKLFPYLSDNYPEKFPPGKFTLDSMTWSALQVWGRAFDTNATDTADSSRRTWGMIPFADLVNHQSYTESFYSDQGGKGPFECWATECFHPGAEVYQSYGSHKTSSHFFLYYGFVPSGYVRNDFIAFRVPHGEVTRLIDHNVTIERGVARASELIGFAGVDGHISEYFIAAYHAFLSELGLLPKVDPYKFVLGTILSSLEKTIHDFPTTYDEDFAALSKGFENYDRWVTLTIRTRFKFVMDRVVENLKHRIASKLIASTEGWSNAEQDWLLTYDDEEVSAKTAEANAKDSLYVVEVDFKTKNAGDTPADEVTA